MAGMATAQAPTTISPRCLPTRPASRGTRAASCTSPTGTAEPWSADRTWRISSSFSWSATTPPREVCPVWPGHLKTAHRGIPGPAVDSGSTEQVENAFREAFLLLDRKDQLVPQPAFAGPRHTRHLGRNRQDRSSGEICGLICGLGYSCQ
jgi:hypothetical protein